MQNVSDYWQSIIGKNSVLKQYLERAKRVAPSDCTVLITGETGTGKELVARGIHMSSKRAGKPFVAINCAAISKDLIESELFGHVQGAFTSAVKDRKGRIQTAEEGTIFLDEIGDLPLELQGKLLRVLQFKEYSPVGDSKIYNANVRVIAATNAKLEQMVKDGTFRQDLYYRLNVVNIYLPPLRQRMDDMDILVDHLLNVVCKRLDVDKLSFTPKALAMLKAHSWPGNIRELENAVEHAVIMAAGTELDESTLPNLGNMTGGEVIDFAMPLTGEGIDLQEVLRKIESQYIQMALEQTSGNKNQAAGLLGLNRTTLVEKLKRALPNGAS